MCPGAWSPIGIHMSEHTHATRASDGMRLVLQGNASHHRCVARGFGNWIPIEIQTRFTLFSFVMWQVTHLDTSELFGWLKAVLGSAAWSTGYNFRGAFAQLRRLPSGSILWKCPDSIWHRSSTKSLTIAIAPSKLFG